MGLRNLIASMMALVFSCRLRHDVTYKPTQPIKELDVLGTYRYSSSWHISNPRILKKVRAGKKARNVRSDRCKAGRGY